MPVSLSGMTLYTNGDNETGYDGVTSGPDTYNVSQQGTNSESWNVAKNSTETSTLTKSATMPTSRGLYVMWMKSDLSYYYTDIKVKLQSSAGNDKEFTIASAANPAISGDFHAAALDYVNKGVATGTYDPANHAASIVAVNNSSSGNIRAVINNWIDAIYFGAGLVISGTTVGDKCFTEAAAVDQNGSNEFGILENIDGIIHAQGDITLDGTALVSNGETLVFRDTTNGFDRYNLNGSGSFTGVNTNLLGSGAIDYDLDASSMTVFSMTGGSIVQVNALTLTAGQTLDGVVLTDVKSSSIANTPSGSTWNLSGTITLQTGGTLDGCKLNKTTDPTAVITDDLADVAGCEFVSDGSSHAVELNSIGAGSMTWDVTTSGYDAGATGSPVTPTSTGNEDIYVNVGSGTLTINVASGATVPSIRSAGAIVNVVAGQVTLTIKGWVSGGQLVIYDDDSADPQELGTELQRNNNITSDENFTYDPAKIGDDIVIKMIPPTSANKTIETTVTLGSNNSTETLKQVQETN